MELSITFTTGTKSVETLLKSSQKKPGWYFGGSRGREDKAWTSVLTSRVLKRSKLRSFASHHHHHHIMIIKPPDSFKGQIVKCKVQIKRSASQLKHVLCYLCKLLHLVKPAAPRHDDPHHALGHPCLPCQHRCCQDLLHPHLICSSCQVFKGFFTHLLAKLGHPERALLVELKPASAATKTCQKNFYFSKNKNLQKKLFCSTVDF